MILRFEAKALLMGVADFVGCQWLRLALRRQWRREVSRRAWEVRDG